jgi:hypothetical protein
MANKTLALLEEKASSLSNILPEGSWFSIRPAYDGYQLAFDGEHGCHSSCGYERKGTVIAQFDAIWTVLDGLKMCKCSEVGRDILIEKFLKDLSPITNRLEDEMVVVLELLGALIRELSQEKASKIIENIIHQYQERYRFELEEEEREANDAD